MSKPTPLGINVHPRWTYPKPPYLNFLAALDGSDGYKETALALRLRMPPRKYTTFDYLLDGGFLYYFHLLSHLICRFLC